MNILFILLDDLGWNDVGIHNKKIKTPNIDKISQDGCNLKFNYTFPVCGPTRAMIQTGIYAYKQGMQKLINPWIDYGLDLNLKIIPEYLKNLNYSTYAIGKWHLGHNRKIYLPHNRGYDYHFGNLTGAIDHVTHLHCNPLAEARKHDFSENGRPIYPKGHACEIVTDKVLNIIDNHNVIKNNFFIYLAYLSPHLPYVCPDNFKEYYKDIKEPRKSYLAMITHLDNQIGRIIKNLEEKNIYDDTLIWIMSDNGGWTPEWAGGDNFPLKDGKASFYEGGIRTLSIIKQKKIKIKNFEGVVHCTDVLPTILEFCNCKEKIDSDGISLFKFLCNKKNKNNRNIVIGFYGENHWCFLINNLKFIKLKKNSPDRHLEDYYGRPDLIEINLEEDDIKYIECYDVINDPEEKNNIIKEKYKFFKEEIQQQIIICHKKRIYENFQKEPEEEVIKKCKRIRYWGQQFKKDIKILFLQENKNEENKKYIESKSNLLELTGYDVFY